MKKLSIPLLLILIITSLVVRPPESMAQDSFNDEILPELYFPADILHDILATGDVQAIEDAGATGEMWLDVLREISDLKDYTCTLHVFLADTTMGPHRGSMPRAPGNTSADSPPGKPGGQDSASPGPPGTPPGPPSVPPGQAKKGKKIWFTLRMEYKWKRPGYSYMKVLEADTPAIDYVTEHMKKSPGTVLVYGFKDEEYIYGKFPPTGVEKLDEQIGDNVFREPVSNYEMQRPNRSFADSMHTLARYLSHYFSSGDVLLRREVCEIKEKPSYSAKKSEPVFETRPCPGPQYQFVFIPEDQEENGGITREVLWVDTFTKLPFQWETYQDDKLVLVVSAQEMNTDTGLTESLWEDFFDGAVIGD